jgi:hypothetical protein
VKYVVSMEVGHELAFEVGGDSRRWAAFIDHANGDQLITVLQALQNGAT